MGILMFVLAGLCVFGGISPYLYRGYVKKNGTLTFAEIVSYHEEYGIARGNNHHSFYAVLSYQVNGVKYQTAKAVQIPKRSAVGESAAIYVLGGRPEKIITKGRNMFGKSNHLILILIAIIFFFWGIYYSPGWIDFLVK